MLSRWPSCPFRDVDELLVGITTPGGHALTAIVRVDNEIGARDAEVDDVLHHVLASPWGRPWTRAGLAALAEAVLGKGLQNALGDPLLWAPHHVRRLLDSDPGDDLLDEAG